jgi:glycosyltransferase involved in cell wall biosynthesis
VRIAHVVCTDGFAGVEQYVVYVSAQQAIDGHEVTVLGGNGPAMHRAIVEPSVTWSPASTMFAAQRALLDLEVDLLHVHMTAAEMAAVTTSLFHRLPIVSTLHFAHPRGNHRRRGAIYRRMAGHLDAQIAISDFVARESGERCDVILNGVPWETVDLPRRRVVLVAQRLDAEKDTELAIRAWAASGLASRGWRLEIAGDGVLRGELYSIAQAVVGDDSVGFLGYVSDVKERMSSCSILLATAPAEPFGLSVVEAMAAATPVVLSASGAHLETAGPVGTEGLFTPGSVEQCADRLVLLADDEELRVDYGRRLRHRWETDFQIDKHCARVERVYRRVLAER